MVQGGHLIEPRGVGWGSLKLTTTTDTGFCTGYPGPRALEGRLSREHVQSRAAAVGRRRRHVKYSYSTSSASGSFDGDLKLANLDLAECGVRGERVLSAAWAGLGRHVSRLHLNTEASGRVREGGCGD